MKFKFLGTAAAEGFPALFCNCEYCKTARSLGGKNIRTRSQAIIDDELLIDFPADTYSHFLKNNIEGDKIKNLIITHSHGDHFYLADIIMRSTPYAHNMREEKLNIYCGKGVEKILTDNVNAQGIGDSVICNRINEFETKAVGDYFVTALPARHFLGDGALIYLIKKDKTILYAHDTGYFYDEVFNYLADNKIKLDFITLDCTCGELPVSKESSHMNLENIREVLKRLSDTGVIDKDTKKVINHFSHNANPIHHLLEDKVKSDTMIVSYDGMEINI